MVASFESRMADELARLIERHGGRPLIAPALRELPLSDLSAVHTFAKRVLAHDEGLGVDVVVLMTGVGTTALFEALRADYEWSAIQAALRHTSLVARGPKPAAALKALGLKPALTVPAPNTWVEVVSTLDGYRPVKGQRVAVQEYGVSNPHLLDALKRRGAEVFAVPIYKWALPEDLSPVRQAIDRIIAGEVDVLLVTNAAQADHVMQVLDADGTTDAFRTALRRMVIASIGPTTSEHLRELEWPITLEPSRSKMGTLVKEVSERVGHSA